MSLLGHISQKQLACTNHKTWKDQLAEFRGVTAQVPLPDTMTAVPFGAIKSSVAPTKQSIKPGPLKHGQNEAMPIPITPSRMKTARNDSCVPVAMTLGTLLFDPKVHLAFKKDPEIIMMKDIGFPKDLGVSPVAVALPFKLFSDEAVQIMRNEIFKSEVMENHKFSSNIAPAQLRGYAAEHAPFTYAAWTHPDTVAIISRLAGVDLIPWGDYEIAHINLSFKTEEQAQSEREAFENGTDNDNTPIVGWHTDSYPFVCVLMLSDCDGMVGGETALRTGDGSVMRVRGPTQGCAVILQGRYITHQALRALGAKERITAVTSFRPRSSFVKDDSVLRTVRPVSNLNDLYHDFADYRLKIMEDRIKQARNDLAAHRKNGNDMDVIGLKSFLTESSAFLQHTNKELVDQDQVEKGQIETLPIPDVVVTGTPMSES